jgi:aminobenzoyl-glutamate utilization protein B
MLVKINNFFCFFLLSKFEKISTPMCIPFDRAITAPKKITHINKKIVNSPAQAKAEFKNRRGANFIYKPLLGNRPPALNYRK